MSGVGPGNKNVSAAVVEAAINGRFRKFNVPSRYDPTTTPFTSCPRPGSRFTSNPLSTHLDKNREGMAQSARRHVAKFMLTITLSPRVSLELYRLALRIGRLQKVAEVDYHAVTSACQ